MKVENVTSMEKCLGGIAELAGRRRSSLADELQWKMWEKSLKVGIRRHDGYYQLRDRRHAPLAKSTGYHGNHWEVEADNLELGTRRLTVRAVDEAVMKRRDTLVQSEAELQFLAAKRLEKLNEEFLKTIRASQKSHNKTYVQECERCSEHYGMVLEELLHYHNSNTVEEMAEIERERRMKWIGQLTVADVDREAEVYLRELAATNEKMDVVRASLMAAMRTRKVEMESIREEEEDHVRDFKDKVMREMLWREKEKKLKDEMELAREDMIRDRDFIYNSECQMCQFHTFQLVMRELLLSFKHTEKLARIEKEKKELAIRENKEALLEELRFWLTRCNVFTACASERSSRVRRAESERLAPPDVKGRSAILAVHEEMILDYFKGRRLLATSKTAIVPSLPTDHDRKLYQIRTRARIRTPIIAGRNFPTVKK
ncbi:uncharacterized protein LOC135498788 isoform X2 [Lineus longissimus]|uniref:uncharacterized protein LOC135498788 isoform X2 n=1 Tax=Lineus longissimus TaxID=88925 RepID=UPI00315D921B